MTASASDVVFQLFQFIALALPAVAIYLQVLAKIHQAKRTVEIEGTVPKWINEEGVREPQNEANVIEAMPMFVTNAPTHLSFSFGMLSLIFFSLALFPLLSRFAVQWKLLVQLSLILVALGVLSFVVSLSLMLFQSISEIKEEHSS